ncbi:ParB/RepB/Spo0J family partition protein [Deferribacterales bacterium RsTz2092]|nr:chromosome partitioning protein ParB [Deferribacterales bacterium]
MSLNKRLGRGLESLIPIGGSDSAGQSDINARFREIDITDIMPNIKQPRKDFDKDALEALVSSVRDKGVLQPIVVVKTSESKYMLISGERRWRAAGFAGLKTLPALITEPLADTDNLELALIENTQRDDLKPLELARAYRELMDSCDYRQEDVARIAGKSRPAVANTLRLLDLPTDVSDALEQKLISEGHARVFLSIPKNYCHKLLNDVLSRNLSVRQTELLAKRIQDEANGRGASVAKNSETQGSASLDADILAIVREMEQFFDSKVSFKTRGKNRERGVIEIRYDSQDDLDRIVNKVRGEV